MATGDISRAGDVPGLYTKRAVQEVQTTDGKVAYADVTDGSGGGGGGSGNATYVDASIASLSGSSEQLMAANTSRKALFITNIGTAVVNVNLVGGTAVAGAGCIPLLAGASLLLDTSVPTNEITIIGTAGQPVTAYEG